MEKIAIEGIAGSGKTTVAEALAKHLGKRGLKTMVFAPYTIAEKHLVRGVTLDDLWSSMKGSFEATGLLRDVIDDCDEIAELHKVDTVIYDQHWMTGELRAGSTVREEHWQTWGPQPVPTALLRLPIETAMERLPDEEPYWLGQAAGEFTRIAKECHEHILGVYNSDIGISPRRIANAITLDLENRSRQ